MKSITSLALVVGAVAVSSVNGGSLLASVLRPRGLEELWGGYNITAAALEIRDAISSPTCTANSYCQTFMNDTIPRCMKLQGTAGCWCTLHDPLHYCAICMSSPADNTTTSDQTQAAAEGHKNYHLGCAAYQNYLNASAAGSLSSSAPLPTGTSANQTDDHDDHGHGMSTGAIVGIAVGGVAFLVIIGAATFLIHRCLKNQSERNARPAAGATASEKRQDSMPMGDPVRVTSYYGGTDMGDRIPHTPPPPMPYGNQQQYPAQPYSPPIGSPVPLLEAMAARPDSMYTTAQSQANSYHPAMRPGSEFGGSSQGGNQPQQMYQQSQQYHVANDMDAHRNAVGLRY
ncbi:hypothetical protein M407DRAFT_224390 [Tulasnella calospora MUT 4182]|uniref:Extracellular membrane protein CFEM domain-containing protein n=1 Tax=Tulasnella calospora MUT 4182 TaxID=1051891 RepID=A0A0C3QRK2_9AGAM|nr:hypothetical protein M407DRAFT_224390 [Tulasnella calospora MUT 4182]